MINEQDYVKTEKDGVITFTPKKKEVTGERRRVERGKTYWVCNEDGSTLLNTEANHSSDYSIYEYGNYYTTITQQKAVADLRRHVYKFSVIKPRDKYLWLGVSDGYLRSRTTCSNNDIPSYNRYELPLDATPEDQEERIRLVKRCYELNGYVTI